MRQKLTLVRKSNDDAIFKIAAVDKGQVELTKVAWVMPHAHPNEVKMLVCTKALNQRLSWTPHFECVSVVLLRSLRFQSDRSGNQDKKPSLFDHLSTTEALNDTKYPACNVISDFKKHRHVEYYKMFTEFARDYYGLDPLTVTYKEEYPVFYFDVSKQSKRVSQILVDIKIRMRFVENVGANVVAYGVGWWWWWWWWWW